MERRLPQCWQYGLLIWVDLPQAGQKTLSATLPVDCAVMDLGRLLDNCAISGSGRAAPHLRQNAFCPPLAVPQVPHSHAVVAPRVDSLPLASTSAALASSTPQCLQKCAPTELSWPHLAHRIKIHLDKLMESIRRRNHTVERLYHLYKYVRDTRRS